MSALSDKLKQARSVASVQRAATMDMADRIIAKGAELAAARDRAEAAHMAVLDGDMRELEELHAELTLMGNGAPETPSDAGEKPEPPAGTEPGVLAANAWHPDTPYDGTTEKHK